MQVINYSNCLIGEVLDRPGKKSHTSMLETFFVYTLALCMPSFKKKYPLKRLEKSYKLFVVVTLQQWKVCNFLPDVSGLIFSWKLAYKEPSYIVYKKRPQRRSMWLHPWPVQNFANQASHCSALLIGWIHLCSRVYIFLNNIHFWFLLIFFY